MARGQEHGPAQQHEDYTQAASGGPNGIGYPTYSEVSLKLLDNGYEPVPLHPGRKSPRPTGWSTAIIDEAQVRRWNAEFPSAGVGIRTGDVVGIDIDVLDPDIAHQMGQIVEANTGATLMRVGLWPKRLYLVRTDRPFAKKSIRKLEILGKGQQFVAFGIHPDARKPYYWTGETPLDVPVSDLPLVDEATCADLLNELAALLPPIGAQQRKSRTGGPSGESTGPTRNKNGLVLDGRDGWLSATAFHVVHDAIDAGHGTQKPVDCMRRPMLNNSSPGQAVYEPFCGSGTTIIAAETCGRPCHAVELDPPYVDVAVERWQAFTGREAVLEATGETFATVSAERAAEGGP